VETLSKITIAPFVALIRLYKALVSPWLGSRCRFSPTCAEYSIDCFKAHGVFKGIILSIKRIVRCNPFGGDGLDPVPEEIDI
jgi:putative membrane protein insertion efficiency factor